MWPMGQSEHYINGGLQASRMFGRLRDSNDAQRHRAIKAAHEAVSYSGSRLISLRRVYRVCLNTNLLSRVFEIIGRHIVREQTEWVARLFSTQEREREKQVSDFFSFALFRATRTKRRRSTFALRFIRRDASIISISVRESDDRRHIYRFRLVSAIFCRR